MDDAKADEPKAEEPKAEEAATSAADASSNEHENAFDEVKADEKDQGTTSKV